LEGSNLPTAVGFADCCLNSEFEVAFSFGNFKLTNCRIFIPQYELRGSIYKYDYKLFDKYRVYKDKSIIKGLKNYFKRQGILIKIKVSYYKIIRRNQSVYLDNGFIIELKWDQNYSKKSCIIS